MPNGVVPGPLSPATTKKSSTGLTAYRDWLIKADHRASEAYDKAVMTLSGGALAISITFIHDIAPSPDKGTVYLLGIAWGSFGLSIAVILVSKLTSQWALRKAMRQIDQGTIHQQRPGAAFSVLTAILNVLAGLTFLVGVAALSWFAIANMGHSSHASPIPDL